MQLQRASASSNATKLAMPVIHGWHRQAGDRVSRIGVELFLITGVGWQASSSRAVAR